VLRAEGGGTPYGDGNQVKIIWSLYVVSNDFIFRFHYMSNLYTNNLYQSLFNINFLLFSFLLFLTLLLNFLFVGFTPSNIL